MEDDTTPAPAPKEIVRNTGSSKKADVPPASADPSKAKKKAKVTGNEGALKNKVNNKTVPGPSATPSKHSKKSFDRHSRSGKTDSAKKLKQGWGSDDKRDVDESAAAADAEAEAEDEANTVDESPAVQKKSLQDYFAELALKKDEFASKTVRKANQGAEDKWTESETITKDQEAFIQPTQGKKLKSKAPKEKKFLDIDAKFADETSSAPKKTFESKRPARGRGGKATSSRKPASSGAAKPAVDDKNFPSL